MSEEKKLFTMSPIGSVQRDDSTLTVVIDEAYRPALLGLGDYSHIYVYWWAERFDDDMYREHLVSELPYAPGHEAGVFACRSPIRPNLIMNTVCEVVSVDEAAGIIQVRNIDAFSDTPVLDIKPYYPVTDRIEHATIPDYLVDWPEWVPEEGVGLMDFELESA